MAKSIEKILRSILLTGLLSGIINETSFKNEYIRYLSRTICATSLIPLIITEEYARSKRKY